MQTIVPHKKNVPPEGSQYLLQRLGERNAWLISLLTHAGGLVLLGALTLHLPFVDRSLLLSTAETPAPPPLDNVHFSEGMIEQVGAGPVLLPNAPAPSDQANLPEPEGSADETPIVTLPLEMILKAPDFNHDLPIRGEAGAGVTGFGGAVDRITHEILRSLEQRRTLVVWLFDQSGSLQRRRDLLVQRLDRIYQELGILEARANPAFTRHKDRPLLTSIMAFGSETRRMTPDPTDELDTIKSAIDGIETDTSGVERVFHAIDVAASRFRTFRSGPARRNVMLIVVTDEAGNDLEEMDAAVDLCRRLAMPVYVIGVPAPFGRRQALVKYVDPDPAFDQTPQWPAVDQGPESLMPERVRIRFRGEGPREEAIDSGFGPYGLTRICVETGGIYFAVHPNRDLGRDITRRETTALAAHLKRFFDPTIMRAYRPDYVSTRKYEVLLKQNKARAALVQAASLPWVGALDGVETRFPKRSDAELAALLTRAQQKAARLEPKILRIYRTLQQGVHDRKNLTRARWQAGFDLGMGRTMAALVRAASYNAMLAQAKQGMAFADPHNDTWLLQPSAEAQAGSKLKKLADQARNYLQRVVREHAGTPWEVVARKELDEPLGWTWTESTIGLRASVARQPNNRPPRMPRDDRARRLIKPKPKRKPPAL
ncbi:MAG: vWA domain-containing protein [Pirellulales bacterium]